MDDFETALSYYTQACETRPDLAPAQYGLAQMLAAQSRTLQLQDRKEEASVRLNQAIVALNRVLDKVPNDPDALTLLGLLLAEQNKTTTSVDGKAEALEKLKKAVELRPDVKETWIALAQVHQREPADLKEALRCQQEAERLMLQHHEPIPASLLSNLGALLHVKGEQAQAKEYYLKALEAFASSGGTGLGDLETQYLLHEQPIVHHTNAVFWKWTTVPRVQVQPTQGSREGTIVEMSVENGKGEEDGAMDQDDDDDDGLSRWQDRLKPGEQFKLVLGPGARDGFVSQVASAGDDDDKDMVPLASPSGTTLRFSHSFFLPTPETPVPVATKVSRGLLRHETLTTVFNLAMIHQDMGEFAAAKELFLAIIQQYPSYVAAYVKLGLLAQSQGNTQEAQTYLGKAREIAKDNRDVQAICGKVEQEAGRRDQAQRIFEPLNKEGDPYAMVALGNLYVPLHFHIHFFSLLF